MNNFGTIFKYECRKIFTKKIFMISTVLCVIAIVLTLTVPLRGDYYGDGGVRIDSNKNMYLKDKEYAEALDGRIIDQELIEETVEAYRKVPQDRVATEEYLTYARPYSEIFNFIRSYSGIPLSELYSWEPNESEAYEMHLEMLEKYWENLRLGEGEKEFWRAQEEKIVKPITYHKTHFYNEILSGIQTVGLMVLMIIAICLSGIFSSERQRGTDSIMLCTKNGKSRLYLAKIAAAIIFSTAVATLLFAATLLIVIAVYGPDDPSAVLQLIYPQTSAPITCAKAVGILFVSLLAAAVVTGILCAVLSEALGSGIAVIAVMIALLIIPMMFSVPEQYRIAAQIWNWLPFGYVSPRNIFGSYTFQVFGKHFTAWQAVPWIYAVLSVAVVLMGFARYRRWNVGGR